MYENNKEVVKQFMTALGNGDVEGIKRLITKDFVAIATGTSIVSGERNYDDILAATPFFKEITESGVRFEFLNLTAEDDRVAVEMVGHAMMKHGVPYNNEYHMLIWLRDGKVCRMKEYFDCDLTDRCFGPYISQANPLTKS